MRYILMIIFATVGLGLGAINVWNNSVAINNGHLVFNDLTAMVAGLAITAMMLSASLAMVFRRSAFFGVLVALTIVGCTATSLHLTLTRVGGVSDGAAKAALSHNAKIDQTQSEVKRLVAAESAECSTGIGPKCRKLGKDLQAAKSALVGLGARQVVDPAAERVSAALQGVISPAQYRVALPLITAGSLELGVNLLVAVAGMFASGGNRKQVVVEAQAVDITPADPVVCLLRRRNGAKLTNAQVADALGISAPAASNRVKRLVADGVVRRERVGREVAIRLN